jgi:hypothetical protein
MIKQVTSQSTELYGRAVIKHAITDNCLTDYDPLHVIKTDGVINQRSL